MSLPRPSGLKQPSRIGRPSALPPPRTGAPSPSPASHAQSAIAKSARGIGLAPRPADKYALSVSQALKDRPDGSLDSSFNTDDFKIGDRVWVSGTKPGMIAFIGEAQFAPGDWAGVVLDEAIGKNDGSVMGVRYFQCEAKRGVFSRLTKLSSTPQSPSHCGHDSSSSDSKPHSGPAGDTRLSVSAATTNGTSNTSVAPPRPSSRMGLSSSKAMSTSSSSLHKSPAATPSALTTSTTTMRLPGTMPGGCRVGDKVLVSGSKLGTLRYIGETDFAKGIWAGVELIEPLGKNDGAVAGKRYFESKPMHGLFAPIHKISRAGSSTSTPSPHSRPLMSTSLRLSRERSGSQESVSSISSTASSVSRSRVRLGVTSLANQASKTGQRPSTLNLSATTAALQKTLKEKEEHIEQLLRERDLERSEVARAAAHVDEAEVQLSSLKTEKDRMKHNAEEEISHFQQKLQDLENEKQELTAFLEEEKRKVEDLQFQLEEETLKDEDGKSEVDEFQMKELERQLKKEKERAERFEKDVGDLKVKLEQQQKAAGAADDAQTSYLDQIEELTYKLTQAETKVKSFEVTRVEDGVKTSQVSIELDEKASRVRDLEDQLARQKKEMSGLSQQLTDVKEELTTVIEKRSKQDDHIQELTNNLKQLGDENKQVAEELRNANLNSADLQRQLTASQTKTEELAADRAKLEKQLSELMKNSGDSSSQLASLNDQLTEKNRKVEDLQSDLLSYSQNLAKEKEAQEELRREKDSREQEITSSYEGKLARLQEEIKDSNLALEKSKTKINQVTETLEKESKEALGRKDEEIESLRQHVSQVKEEQGNQDSQLTAHKQLLDTINSEKSALQHQLQQSEKQLKRLDGDKAGLNTELAQARVEVSKLQSQLESTQGNHGNLQDQVERLTLEVNCLNQSKAEATKQKTEHEMVMSQTEKERDSIRQELVTSTGEVQKKDIQLEELQRQVEKLSRESEKRAEEMMIRSQTEAELLTHELNSLKTSMQAACEDAISKDGEIARLKTEVEHAKGVQQDKDRLIKERDEVVKEREASDEKCRNFIKEIEKKSGLADTLQSDVKTLQASEGALKREKESAMEQLAQMRVELDGSRQEAETARSNATAASASLTSDDKYVQLKEAADGAKGQVDFLNSVIVELQGKNHELHVRLSAMEDSGIHTNGEFSEPVDVPSTTRRAAPRLFCDICDVFDIHDTEDCPKQAMSNSPEPTRHHGDRKNVRPYCEICESFGHWTDDCEDEETF